MNPVIQTQYVVVDPFLLHKTSVHPFISILILPFFFVGPEKKNHHSDHRSCNLLLLRREGMNRLSLPLKVAAATHHSNALIHDPFSKVEVLVDCGANVFGFDLLGLEARSGG